jgi:glutathionylspermidine synthase
MKNEQLCRNLMKLSIENISLTKIKSTMKFKKIAQSPTESLKQVGWDWMLGEDTLPYLTDEILSISENEANAYYEATNELFEMYVAAGQYVIDNELFNELGIPENLISLIKISWEDERNIHLYGRFDLAGGIDKMPIKLIEFNADTATCIPETAVVQWLHLKANSLDESQQFNSVYETLVRQFREIKQQNSDLQPTMLFSAMRDFAEDETNVSVLMKAAEEAGFEVGFAYIDEVDFSTMEGIFIQDAQTAEFIKYDFWFKLIPWEFIGWDEPELAEILTEIVKLRKAIVLNPAYTLLFQSKAILRILWELYPNHPLLLETRYEPLFQQKSVQKVLFGREGANVKILDEKGFIEAEADGEYQTQRSVYQAFTDFPKDSEGNFYQAGVFFAGEACGLGFRKGGKIIDNRAGFVGHLVE